MEKKLEGQQTYVACPAYEVCAHYGTARHSCRYEPGSLPPIGVFHQHPQAAWCQPGVATLVLMQAEQMGVVTSRCS